MSIKKISQLPIVTTLDGTESVVINKAGVTSTVTAANLVGNGLPVSVGNLTASGTVKLTSLTGYVYANGSGAVTAATTVPAASVSGSIANAQLANSSVTVNGSAISLGGSATVTAVNPYALTLGSGLTGTSYTGSGAVTAAIDTAVVATLSGSQTLTNKSISGSTNTLSAIPNSALTNSTISGVSLGSNLATLTLGTGLSGTSYNGSGAVTAALANTAVTAGSYTLASITVDAQGRITAASNGTAGSGSVTSVGGTGTVNGLTLTGTVTTTGNLTLGGTLDLSSPPAIGGTTPTTGKFTTLTATGSVNTPNTFGFKNRIINGQMLIDQRNAGSAVTPTATAYTVDRWALGVSQASKLTVQQVSDAPAGAKNSLKVSVAAQYSPSAGEIFQINQAIEGNNIVDLQFGTAGALTITTSFQVKSSITGTFSCSISNGGGTRTYVATYTISSANTWTPLTLTIAGDTTGTWATDNTAGMYLFFDLGSGSNFNATAGAWNAGNYKRTSGSVTFVNQVNGSTWQLAQVQLEAGSVGTSFDVRSIQQELALCQRYYEKSYQQSTAPGSSVGWGSMLWATNGYTSSLYCSVAVNFKVTKRVAPTIAYWDAAGNVSRVSQTTGGGLVQTDNLNILFSMTPDDSGLTATINVPTVCNAGCAWTASAEI